MKVPATAPNHLLKSRKLKLKHGKSLREQQPALGRAGPDSNHLFTVNRYGRLTVATHQLQRGKIFRDTAVLPLLGLPASCGQVARETAVHQSAATPPHITSLNLANQN